MCLYGTKVKTGWGTPWAVSPFNPRVFLRRQPPSHKSDNLNDQAQTDTPSNLPSQYIPS